MAEDGEDRTEAASARRLSEATSEGKVPIGRDINAVAGFAAGTVALISVAAPIRDALIRLVATSAGSFTVGPPAVSSFTTVPGQSHPDGAVGSRVFITGTGFTGATAVRFNGVNAAAFTVRPSGR